MVDNKERADALFEKVLGLADSAAALDNAAGYNVAINALKYAASVLHPEKYGTEVKSSNGATEGYILETGIRRQGDPGFVPSGALQNEQKSDTGSAIPSQNGLVEGQDFANDMGLDPGSD